VGLNGNIALGEFCAELTVDGHFYPILIGVVAENVMSHKILLGIDFLNTVELRVRNEMSVSPVENMGISHRALPEIFQIDVEREEIDKVDLKHITNNEHQSAVENFMNNYKPDKVKKLALK